MKFIYAVFPIVILTSACSGRLNSPPENEKAEESSLDALAEQSFMSLVSNSTQSQPLCENANTVVLQMAISAKKKMYCRDASTLMDSVSVGLVCDGGVEVNRIVKDNGVVSCDEVTVCGVPRAQSRTTADRLDGSKVNEVTFRNLPWGCQARIQASTSTSFDGRSAIQEVKFQILPPTCRYCPFKNAPSCGSCVENDPAGFKLIFGQRIPNTCPWSQSGCASCKFPPNLEPGNSEPKLIPHGAVQNFFLTESAACNQSCSRLSLARVCNDGSWVPGQDKNYVSQCIEPDPDSCIGASVQEAKVAENTIKTMIASVIEKVQSYNIFNDGPIIATCASCQSGGCATCETANGQGFKLYSQTDVPSGQRCEDVSQCLRCVDGLFQGGLEFKYGSCQVLDAPCTAFSITGTVPTNTQKTFYSGPLCAESVLTCRNGMWRDSENAVVEQTLVDSYLTVCTKTNDCTTLGGILIRNGSTTTVYNVDNIDAVDNCTSHAKTLTCFNGNLNVADPGETYRFQSCKLKTCPNPMVEGNTIQAGSSFTRYSAESASCDSLPDPTGYCSSKMVSAACPSTGGTATVSPAGVTDFSEFRFLACKIPDNCTGCTHVAKDGKADVRVGEELTLFSQSSTDLCVTVSKKFKCQSSGNSPQLVDPIGTAKVSDYAYLNCRSLANPDEGELGGTGGGTGNDEGPGSAIRKRFGSVDGGGGGGGCVDATQCNTSSNHINGAISGQDIKFAPCKLPWGGGIAEAEFYASITAFGGPGVSIAAGSLDTICVVKPDRCSLHRQVRTCHFPDWTGDPTYKYPNCVEKDVCP